MKKAVIIFMVLAAVVLASCVSNDYTASLAGVSEYSTLAVKDFTTLGIITVSSTEIHSSGPFGFTKSVEGSKITFADLMQEAAKLEADDVINVRIDMNSNYTKRAFGWTRTYTYTATALAIKYTDKVDVMPGERYLSGLPKIPETTGAVKTTKSGSVVLK